MKRRFLNIAFALVLMPSLGLVTAAPAAAIDNESVEVNPDTASTVDADYHVFFLPDVTLEEGVDTITIVFPDDTVVTPGSLAGTVATGAGPDKPITTINGDAGTQTVTITTPVTASDQNQVRVKLTAGITNPSTPKWYTLDVETSQEPGLVTFPQYEITAGAPPPTVTDYFTLNAPADITAGIRAAYTVTRYDSDDDPVTSGDQIVYLFTNSNWGAFYDASADGSVITQVTIGGGASAADFWYYDEKAGDWIIWASDATPADFDTGIDDAPDTLTVNPAAADSFVFDAIGEQVAGTPFAITVTAYDEYDNVATGYEGSATLSDETGSIDPTTTGAFSAGTWTGDVTITGAMVNDTITATDGDITGTSGEFEIKPGPVDTLTVQVQPSTANATAAITPAVEVKAADQYGNPVPGVAVTASKIAGTGTLSGTLAQATDGSGIATFDDLSIDEAGAGKVLHFADNGNTVDSDPFEILVGPVADLTVINQPAQTTAGDLISAVKVEAVDAGGNVIKGLDITASLISGTGTLSGTKTQATDGSGIATFADLWIDLASTKTLRFTADAVTEDSASFKITPADFAAYTVLPEDVTCTANVSFDVTITATDQYGNPVGAAYVPDGPYDWVTNASDAPDGTSPDIDAPLGSDNFTAGVAVKTVTCYCAEDDVTFTVTDNSSITGTSDNITVIHGEGITSFDISPDDESITADQNKRYITTATDNWGNEFSVTELSTFSIEDGAGGEWDGNLYYAGYVGVWLVKADYDPWTDNTTLTVTPGAADQLIIADGTQPTDTVAGEAISPVTVVVKDSDGNLIPGQEITASLGDGTGTLHSLSDNLTLVANASGNVTFDDLWIDLVGEKQLEFNAGDADVLSESFVITPGDVVAFTFDTIPSPQDAGVPFEVTIKAIDAYANVATDYTGMANLTDLTGTVTPTVTDNFTDGVWATDNVTVKYGHPQFETMQDAITVTDTEDSGITGTSNEFTLNPFAVYNTDTGEGYASIQDAIDAASPGDTIIVGPGVYEFDEPIKIEKNLTLMSSHGPTETKLTAIEDIDEVIYIGDYDVIIEGFDIDPADYGIHIPGISAGTTVTIENAVIHDNAVAGIQVDSDNGTLNVLNSIIAANGDFGICIDSLDEGGSADITGNKIGAWQDDYYDLDGNGIVGIYVVEIYNGSTVTVEDNAILMNRYGIYVEDPEDSTVDIHYNSIVGNDLYGLYNDGDGIVDAICNWWSDVAGPYDNGPDYVNPYNNVTNGDEIYGYIDYIPWSVQSELTAGWNIWSRPIVPDEDSWAELVATFDGAPAAYFFNSETQYWDSPANAGPLDAFYFKMAEATAIRYCINSEATFPSQKAMKMGWNLVGLAELHEMQASEALLDAYWGTGVAEDLTGYSKVISLSLNGEFWTFLRPAIMKGPSPDMLPCKGYWVFMVNDGTLGGFTTTPIVEVAP